MITCASVSSTQDVVFGVSIVGGIHSTANRLNWKVLDYFYMLSQVNENSKLYPTPTVHRSYLVNLQYTGTGAYQASQLQSMNNTQIVNQDILRSSSIDSFTNPVIDIPKTRRIINPSLVEEYPNSNYIRGIIKLKKRIIPNSLIFSHQQDSIFLKVDPRKQSRNITGEFLEEGLLSTIPAGYRYKEMRLNHYGFYDIEYEKFNK